MPIFRGTNSIVDIFQGYDRKYLVRLGDTLRYRYYLPIDFLLHYKLDGTDANITRVGTADYKMGPECDEAISSWHDGSTQFQTANPDSSVVAIGGNAFSTSGWIRTKDYATLATIMTTGSGAAGQYEVSVADTGKMQIRIQSITKGADIFIADGNWHHYAITSSAANGTFKMYIDANLITNTTAPNYNLTDSGAIAIGSRSGGTNKFTGGLDGMKFYNRELSQSEVSALYANRCDFNPSQLTSSLYLNAQDQTTITESAGAVSLWEDVNGNSIEAEQTVAANKPTTGTDFNGMNSISFDGSLQYLQTNLRQVTTGSVYMVLKTVSKGMSSNSTPISASSVWNGGGLYTTVTDFDTGTPVHNVFYTSKLATGDRYYYGQNIDTPPYGKWIISHDITSATTENLDYRLGADLIIHSTLNFEGDIFSVLILPTVSSVAQRQKIEGFYAWETNTTSSLEVTHPYRTVTPKE